MDCSYRSMHDAVFVALLLAVARSLIGCDAGGDDGGDLLAGPTEFTESQKATMMSYIDEQTSKPESVAAFYEQSTRATKDFMGEITNGATSPGRRLKAATAQEIIAGVSVFGTQLFAAVEKLLPDEVKSLAYYSQFKAAWLDLFANLGDKSAKIVSGIEEYIENVNPEALVDVVQECIIKAKELVEAFLPAEVYEAMGKYFDGVVSMFQGFSRGWKKFSDFLQADGVVAVYDGVRDGLQLVLPKNISNDETYSTIIGILDDGVASLSKNVAMFTKRLTENKVCWRKQVNRLNQRAQVCQDGYAWDGDWQCVHNDNKNTRPALCDASSEYKDLFGETSGRRCYRDCDVGLEPMSGKETQCATTCSEERRVAGKFPRLWWSSSWDDMCGTSTQVFADIQHKITERTLHVIATTVGGIIEAVENTELKSVASSMHKIIESVLDWAAELVFPQCEPEPSQCSVYMTTDDCSWTKDWNCEGQSPGSRGSASDDGTMGYNCCCKEQLWKGV